MTLAVPGMMLASLVGAPVVARDQGSTVITVGSMSFTEQRILGEMISLMLEDAGYNVERKLDLGTSADAHQALVSGEIDVYVEYTGGGLVAILGSPVPTAANGGPATPVASVRERVYDTVAEGYLEEFGVVWLDELGFNNSYAMAVTAGTADELDLDTISDLKGHASDMTLGTDQEFPDRQDGLSGLEKAYGLEFGEVKPGDPGLMYTAIENGDVDIITAYTTDGRLPGLDLVILEDDRGFFPPYYAAPVVRQDVLVENPELADVLNQLSGQVSEAEMAGMNYQVDVEGKEPIDVARAFLENEGIIDAAG